MKPRATKYSLGSKQEAHVDHFSVADVGFYLSISHVIISNYSRLLVSFCNTPSQKITYKHYHSILHKFISHKQTKKILVKMRKHYLQLDLA